MIANQSQTTSLLNNDNVEYLHDFRKILDIIMNKKHSHLFQDSEVKSIEVVLC